MDLEQLDRDPSRQVAVTGLLTNSFAAVGAAGGAVITGSAIMLGLGVNAAVNLGSQVLLLAARRRSGRARRALAPRHPLGHQRERYFGAFALGMLLGSVGGVLLLAEGIGRLRHPPDLDGLSPAVAVAVATVVVTGGSLVRSAVAARTDLAASGGRVTNPASWWRYFVGTKRPVLAAALLEDTVAFGCRLSSAVLLVVADLSGEAVLDPAGLLAIGILTAMAGMLHAVLLKHLVVGEVASGTDQQGIAAAIEIEPSVVRLAHMETYRRGPEELLVAAKIELVDGLDLTEVAEVSQRLEAGIRRAVPAARAVYLEPQVFRTSMSESERRSEVRLSKPDLLGRILSVTWLRSLRAPTGDEETDDVDEPDRVGQPPSAK